MPDNTPPEKQDKPAATPPPVAWPAAPAPDAFYEFSPGSNWPTQQRPAAGPPPGYFQQGPAAGFPPGYPQQSQPTAGYSPPGAPPWSPVPGQMGVQAPPTWPQGMPPGAWQPPGQPRGVTPPAPPPTPKNSRLLMAMLGGLVLVVILVTVVLWPRGTSPQPTTTQATTTPKAPTATATPNGGGGVFIPDGTAPTSKDCNGSIAIPCYSPEQMQQAFGLTSLYKQGITGQGQTIVIIGAGNSPNVENDLHAFDKAYGLPDPPSFKILQPFGPPVPYVCTDGFDGLQVENTLDVEWSHAMAPGASIVLVIGANNERKHTPPPDENKCGLDYLEDDVAYALDNHLGNIISISYGGSELGGDTDTAQDKIYEQQEFDTGHAVFKRAAQEHVTVLASAGDAGATNGRDMNNPTLFWNKPNISWPASDPYVLAVGGTTLTIQDDSGTYGSEQVWNDGTGAASGGGLSIEYKEPSYQQSVPNQAMFNGMRGIPDVSLPAEVNYSLYFSASEGAMGQVNPKWDHWDIIGGTSASSPSWAGIIALADQMAGQPLGFIQPGLYSLQGKDMHDITTGNNTVPINKTTVVQGYSAGPGYDLASGWGTPIADQLLPALIQAVQQVGNAP
jgi:subtilase family serine protease